MRDIRRHLDAIPAGAVRDGGVEMLARVSKLLHQAPKGKGKIYAPHQPEVDCISKGKARVRYEFGCKVSLATTIDEGFVVGMRAMPVHPYDGHTLAEALEQVETLTDRRPDLAARTSPPGPRRRGPGLPRSRRRKDPGSDLRNAARTDGWAESAASAAQRDRAADWPHEN
jgi:hypothetical protein